MANGKKKDPSAGGKGGRSAVPLAKGGRSISNKVFGVGEKTARDNIAKMLGMMATMTSSAASMQSLFTKLTGKPKKKKSPAMKWSPKGGKGMKKGGKVKRKAK